MLGRPTRKCKTAADLEHPQHFAQGDLRTRREDVAELAEHDVEGCIRISERFSVAFGKVDGHAREVGIVACTLEQDRR